MNLLQIVIAFVLLFDGHRGIAWAHILIAVDRDSCITLHVNCILISTFAIIITISHRITKRNGLDRQMPRPQKQSAKLTAEMVASAKKGRSCEGHVDALQTSLLADVKHFTLYYTPNK